MARALAARPYLLLLDEVLAGLNSSEIGNMVEMVKSIRERGITIIMIEHVMKAVMSVSTVSSCWITANRSLKAPRKKFQTTKKSSKPTWAIQNWLRNCYRNRRIKHGNLGSQRYFLRLWRSTDPVGFQPELEKGKLTCLVGGNGVGKTTLLRTVMGLIRPWKGSIAFEGQDVSRLPAYTKAEMGLILVPEGRQLFTDMSVYENLEMGASNKRATPKFKENLERVHKMFPRLKEREAQKQAR
jgi:ABC-type branched-subunit amino acid transport system ATPase component